MWPADGAEDLEDLEPAPLHLAILEALFARHPSPVVIALVVAGAAGAAVLVVAGILAVW